MAETLEPLPPCTHKKGHKLEVSMTKRETTQLCFLCGIARRFANEGPLDPIPMDDLTADQIERRLYGKPA